MKTYKIIFTGQVQGVGFRPYVYTLAHKFNLQGIVSNNEHGVLIIVNGLELQVQNFYNEILTKPPVVSFIKSSSLTETEPQEFTDFQIQKLEKKEAINLPLTPDFSICNECKNEIIDPQNNRFNYPFTTCVNCGPRFAITKSFPFERNHTSVGINTMCSSCTNEYTNPSDRRFHSQTNSCPDCGFYCTLLNKEGTVISTPNESVFKTVAQLLLDGNIIALKNTSGYLLCCNAEDQIAVQKLRRRKNRRKKPFAVLYPSEEKLIKELQPKQEDLDQLSSVESPITIVSLRNYKGALALDTIAPSLSHLGVMLPYSGMLQLLASELSFSIIATSGNIHGSPVLKDNKQALEKLENVADYFLQHNLEILHPQDDSVVKISSKNKQSILHRRARGYAPNFLKHGITPNKSLLATGAHLKSSIAFLPNNYLYISPYLGNLDNYEVFERFSETVKSYFNIFEKEPEIILVDKHPSYQSTKEGKSLAKKLKVPVKEIQHHKAHFAAILGEHNLFDEKVLGVVFDGTGYGDDKFIWGGEFFDYENQKIERIDHLPYFDWLLGDKMALEPRISLLSLADKKSWGLLRSKFNRNELNYYSTIKSGNTLKTSSMGRLFDAVASLLGIADQNSYEGEAAILLENYISNTEPPVFKNYLQNNNDKLDPKEMIQSIISEVVEQVPKKSIIWNFLYSIALIVIRKSEKLDYKHVAFSGGVFQNSVLVDLLIELAPKEIKLYFHQDLSPNDENISYGQILYYSQIEN